MNKILMIQDFHVSPSWIEESERDIDKICQVAKSEKVTAICSAGDFFDRAVIASNKNEWKRILNMARRLQEAAPVYFITGTPSHDAPGCYESFKDIGWKEVTIGQSHNLGGVLIMGMPELTTSFIMANFPEMSKQDVISKQYELVESVIENYYTPTAYAFNGYVHFMGHGHVQGSKFKDNQKPRTSDFMLSETMLHKINATYSQFGHIHLPQRFKSSNGGYGGSPHLTWGDTGFVPSFQIITYSEGESSIQNYFFDKLKREKVTLKRLEDLNTFNKIDNLKPYENTDLWIDIHCDKEFSDNFDIDNSLLELKSKINLGPLSKITTTIQHVEHTRIDIDEYEKCKTTEELYKLYNPEASKSILLKVKEAEESLSVADKNISHHRFEFLDLYLKGSKAGHENGVEEIKIDFNDFDTGINLILGPNGTGKSFTLGFCTPFSCHLPTGIDFKGLFESKDSQILRRFKDGDNIITQKILIDPTLANPTAKYYMDINGKACNDSTNKAPFDDSVFKVFGSMEMFIACAFRGQKENKNIPNLENAKESDLRQIFTELSGIDRTPWKEYAHTKVKDLKIQKDLDARELETLQEFLIDTVALETEIKTITDNINIKSSELADIDLLLSNYKDEYKSLDNIISQNKLYKDRLKELNDRRIKLYSEISNYNNIIAESQTLPLKVSELEQKIDDYNSKVGDKTVLSERLNKLQSEYNNLYELWLSNSEEINNKLLSIKKKGEDLKSIISTSKNTIGVYESTIKSYETQINDLNKPCEHCGKLSSTLEHEIKNLKEKIQINNSDIEELNNSIKTNEDKLLIYRSEYKTLSEFILVKPIESAEILELKNKLSSLNSELSNIDLNGLNNELLALNDQISNIESDKIKIQEHNNSIKLIDKEIEDVNLKIVPENTERYTLLESEIYKLDNSKLEIYQLIATGEAEIHSKNDLIAKNKQHQENIDKISLRTSSTVQSVSEWEEIEAAFSPKGIPALELSLIAPIINKEANSLLNIYGDRFRTEIITQDLDYKGKNLIEKFKILVHDKKASDVKNLPNLSGGQVTWVSKALQEAISIIASQRSGITWLYGIMDEADKALDSEIIPTFYDMIGKAVDGKKKLISVSHSSEAKECINSIKYITEFFCKGE